jgi:hypothetical protein
MMASRHHAERNRQSATLRRCGISLRLPLELGQFVASHKQLQLRRLVAEHAKRREGSDFMAIEVEFFVEIVERDGFEIEDAADENPAAKCRMVRHHRCEMSASRPASDEQPIAIKPELAGALAENSECEMNFPYDVSEAGVRRQRVADEGYVDPVGARSLSLRCQ